ncbi:MAG: hypothetical protein ABWY49_03290 [Rhizobium sp.]
MSGLETAIRSALERSERANPEVRARVYQSARQALEAGLRKQDITDVETVAAQRQRLELTIRAIEGEERARLREAAAEPVAAPSAPAASIPPTVAAAPPVPPTIARNFTPTMAAAQPVPPGLAAVPPLQAPRPEAEMELRGETRNPAMSRADAGNDGDLGGMHAGPGDHLVAEPALSDQPAAMPVAGRRDLKPERTVGRRKPRKFFARLLVFCLVVAFLGIGAWWIKTSGVLLTSAQRDTSVRNQPAHITPDNDDANDDNAELDSGSNAGLATIDPQDRFSADWIQIFGPTDAAKAVSGSQAKIENVSENEGPTVRLTSQSSGDDGNVAIAVPAATLQKLGGKPATVAMTLQAITDAPTQITVECSFGSYGGCGRHRFDVTRQKSDALFQLRFDKPLPADAAGKLVFNSDVDGKSTGVNIYAIRVLPGDEAP